MTLKISDDSKPSIDNNNDENQKLKDRSEFNKRRNPEQTYPSNKINNGHHGTTTNHYHSTEPLTSQQDAMNEYYDPEDEMSQSNYRERRNPLPPRYVSRFSPETMNDRIWIINTRRKFSFASEKSIGEFHSYGKVNISVYSIVYFRLQRAQEERTRRNTGRHYDESLVLMGSELNGNYRNGTTNNPSMSSLRHGDLTSYIPNTVAQHATLSSYPPHPNMIAAVNGSTPTHLPYFPANPVGESTQLFDSYLFLCRIRVL